MSNPAFEFEQVHIISENPKAAADWYAGMLGADITFEREVRGAPQIGVELGGMMILIRGRRPGELGQHQAYAGYRRLFKPRRMGHRSFRLHLPGRPDGILRRGPRRGSDTRSRALGVLARQTALLHLGTGQRQHGTHPSRTGGYVSIVSAEKSLFRGCSRVRAERIGFDRDAIHQPALRPIVGDRVVLGRAVVPESH